MGFNSMKAQNATEDSSRPDTTLRSLQCVDEQEALQRQAGGYVGIQTPEILQSSLHGESNDPGRCGLEWAKSEGCEVQGCPVRNVRNGREFTDSPHGQQPCEQFTGESENSLRSLPHEMALGEWKTTASPTRKMQSGELPCTCQTLRVLPDSCDTVQEVWRPNGEEDKNKGRVDIGWWEVEADVGRTNSDKIPCRVDMLKGLGNAQVPLQAAAAFKLLMGATN